MKKKLFSFLFVFLALFMGIFSLVGCVEEQVPEKLSAPVVLLEGDVASWDANSNADKFEVSLSGELSYLENSVTSRKLSDGQSLKLRAIGDGINYSTSDWSNTVTYTAPKDSTPEHVCKFADEWKYDETHHWKECSCGAIDGKVAHSGGTATETEKAKCEVCNQSYGELKQPQTPEHTCSFTGEWKYDETHHWKECSCGAIDGKVAHSGGTATETEKAKCEVCNQSYGELKTPINPGETKAPTYIGIMASNSEPDPEEVKQHLPKMSNTRSVSISEALEAYYANPENSLGDETPIASNYEIYSYSGGTVYVQIWLNNPDQNTILSLKLNGTKHQTGGTLQSFFVEYGDSYLNCVYVAIQIPSNSYYEISYEVTEIEYVEGSNISQEGKAVMIDEDNDTVKIGLPYEADFPTFTHGDTTSTASSLSINVNVSDPDNYVSLSGAWLRTIIFDRENNIIGQQKLVSGDNEITFTGLSANTYYTIASIIYVDARMGDGVYPYLLKATMTSTDEALQTAIDSDILFNETTGKYYPVINVNAELAESFTFTKVELYDEDDELVFTSEYDGSIQISENLLSGFYYTVKIYYKNAANVEQLYIHYVGTENMYSPSVWYNSDLSIGLIDDAILGFEFSDDKSNMENLKIQIWNTKSAQYIAEDVLYLMDNPNAIEELRTELDLLDPRDMAWLELNNRIGQLENTLVYVEEYYSDLQRTDWEELATKGKYVYEFVYGEDEEFFKGKDNKYFVVLKDYQSKRVDSSSWEYVLGANIDYNNGSEPEYNVLSSGWFEIDPAIGEDDFLFTKYDDDYNEIFNIDENNIVHLEVMSRTGYGYESSNAIGYVNQIVLVRDWEIVKVLWTQEEPEHSIDEELWLANVIAALIEGEDVASVFPYGQLEPISFDLDEVDLSGFAPGNYTIQYTYKMFGKTYDVDNPFDTDGWLEYKIKGQLPTATINVETGAEEGASYGSFEIIIPESVNNGYWYNYSIEVRDENNQLVGTYNQDNYWEIGNLSVNYSIRIQLLANDGDDFYTNGEWSDWFTCSPAKCETPNDLYQSFDENGVIISWNAIYGAEKYIYIINGGEELETTETSISGLKDGDTIKVKAVPEAESYFVESDYSETYTIQDNRIQLAAPVVTVVTDSKYMEWTPVDNAEYYEIYDVTNNELVRRVTSTNCSITPGIVYVVKAIPSDSTNYRASESEPVNA